MSVANLIKWFELSPTLPDVASSAYNTTGNSVFPYRDMVFRALQAVAPEDVRVLILGQDPYHSRGGTGPHSMGLAVKASGLSFGFSQRYLAARGKLHSSLLNIRNEVRACNFEVPEYPHDWYTLQHWANQGVLLLNTRLTVLEDEPMSHKGIGWEDAVGTLLTELGRLHEGKLVSLVWGAEARETVDKYMGEHPGHQIRTSHPCQYSNSRASAKSVAFTGSRCFEYANELLTQVGRTPIQW